MNHRAARSFAILTVFVFLPCLAAAGGNPGPGDWGDAPEGAVAYPSLGVVGLFPTCFGGPSGYVWHGNPGPLADMYWGFTVDDEPDGNAGICPAPPYELDECWGPFDGDGGLAIPDTYTISAGAVVPCGQTPPKALGTVCQVLNLVPGGPFEANIVNNTLLDGFVNVLFDWDQSGRWGGSSLCPGGPTFEHAIVNLPVPPLYVGPLSGLSPGPIRIGPNSGFVWVRMTIGNQPVLADWDGSYLFDLGETEDYLLRIDDPDVSGDYGDAPEGALAYPGVVGDFPTCVTIGPTGYVYHGPIDDVFFGPLVDWETDGNANLCPPAPYDQDECGLAGGDAGLLIQRPFTLTAAGTPTLCGAGQGTPLVGCLKAEWGVDIDIFVNNLSNADHWVNVLADWDGDGKWAGTLFTCPQGDIADEHVLVNFVIPAGHSAPLSTLFPPAFTVGAPADGFSWFRFTISDAPVSAGWDGEGQFGDGETEDYLLRIAPPPVDAPELGAGALDGGPGGLRFESVRPNPLRGEASVRLATDRDGVVKLAVYDTGGRRVADLGARSVAAGVHAFVWSGRDDAGSDVGPGVYFLRATMGRHAANAKVVVVD